MFFGQTNDLPLGAVFMAGSLAWLFEIISSFRVLLNPFFLARRWEKEPD